MANSPFKQMAKLAEVILLLNLLQVSTPMVVTAITKFQEAEEWLQEGVLDQLLKQHRQAVHLNHPLKLSRALMRHLHRRLLPQ